MPAGPPRHWGRACGPTSRTPWSQMTASQILPKPVGDRVVRPRHHLRRLTHGPACCRLGLLFCSSSHLRRSLPRLPGRTLFQQFFLALDESAAVRGAYRALLRARWDDAVSLGTPVLITQGGSMSRPILERLGFEPVGHVHMLMDDFELKREP